MEDYEAQEIEFWAKLEEEGMSRSSMLRRSAAAAFGLTIVGGASTAFGANRAARRPAAHDAGRARGALIKAAKKEGHLNTIALPPDWANYGERSTTSRASTGSGSRTTTPTAARRRRTRRFARSRATSALRTPSTSASRSRSRAPTKGCTRSTSTRTTRRSRVRSRTPAASGWGTTGAPSRSATTRRSSPIPRRRSRTC